MKETKFRRQRQKILDPKMDTTKATDLTGRVVWMGRG